MDKNEYNLTSKYEAMETLERISGISFKEWEEAFPNPNQNLDERISLFCAHKGIKSLDKKNIEVVFFHLTTDDNDCKEISENGLQDLKSVIKNKDSLLARFFLENNIAFDFENHIMRINDSNRNIDPKLIENNFPYIDYRFRNLLIKLFKDSQVNAFVSSCDVKDYPTCIHRYPEILHTMDIALNTKLCEKWCNIENIQTYKVYSKLPLEKVMFADIETRDQPELTHELIRLAFTVATDGCHDIIVYFPINESITKTHIEVVN